MSHYFRINKRFRVTLGLLLIAGIACNASLSSVPDGRFNNGHYTNHVVAFEKNCLGFEKLEEYLQDNVNSETDLEVNMQASEHLMASEMQKPTGQRDLELIDALRQLLSFRSMNTCDHASYDILIGLKRATRYPIDRLAKRGKKRGPLRRIEFIMSKYALEHALKCKSVYPIEFDSSYASLTRTQLDQIDALMETIIDARLSASGVVRGKLSGSVLRRIYASFMDKNDSFKNTDDAALILGFLNKSGLLTAHVKEDVQSHIIEPCNYYTRQLGWDIFIPAQLDLGVLDRSNKYKPGMVERRDGFIYGWARFGFCSMLLRDQNHLIKKMITLNPAN